MMHSESPTRPAASPTPCACGVTMAITPATRVSQVLRAGGLPTTLPSSHREGSKVRNTQTAATLRHARFHGQSVVSVTADFESPGLAARRMQDIIDILTTAGYRAERSEHPDSHTVYVWEPGWQTHVGKPIPHMIAGVELGPLGPPEAPAPAQPLTGWRADRLRDGRILVHLADCPAPPPGKTMPVSGRSPESVATEVVGKLLPKGTSAPGAVKLVQLHDCVQHPSGITREDAQP